MQDRWKPAGTMAAAAVVAMVAAALSMSAWPDRVKAADAAAAYPDKYVNIVVAAIPGGPSDIAARVLAKGLAQDLGQSFVVQNRGGAAGNIGAGIVARSAPDGYTLLVASAAAAAINQSLYKDMGFDPQKDLQPISLLLDVPLILAVNPSVPAKNVQELIAYIKSRNGTMTFGSAGNGGAQHITGEMFRLATGLPIAHVPYKGSAGAVTDLVAGRVPMMFDTAITFMPFFKSGQLRPIAVASAQRLAVLPDVPTFAEEGMKGFESAVWFGLFAPAGTPARIVDTLNKETAKVMAQPDWQKLLSETGAQLVDMTPRQFADFDHAEAVKWAKVVKESGATIN
jgi:tripartite-type tricarboxylate transporter receptor subunit TctC